MAVHAETTLTLRLQRVTQSLHLNRATASQASPDSL